MCFEKVDSDNIYKQIFIFATVFCIGCQLPLFYSVVWFERFGSHIRRTIINKIVSTLSIIAIIFIVVVQGCYMLRFSCGPLSPLVCFWLCISKRTIISLSCLLLDSISVLRYLFIFCLKNPAAFNDEFWHLFIIVWCTLISFLFQVLRAMIPGNQLVEYHLCSGEDPSSMFHVPSFGRGIVEYSSLLLQSFIYLRIWIFKNKEQSVSAEQNASNQTRESYLKDIDSKSITGLASNFVFGTCLAFGSVLIVIINFRSCDDFRSFPKFTVVYFTYLLVPCMTTAFIITVWYIKNPVLRQSAYRGFKNFIISGHS